MDDKDNTAAIVVLAESRHLPRAHLEKWLSMEEGDRSAFLQVAQALKLRTGQMVTALDLLEEISAREGQKVRTILAGDAVRRTLQGARSAPERARALLDQLRTLRYPRLKRTLDRLSAEVGSLDLPCGAKVFLPKDLNSEELRLEVRIRSGHELRQLIEALERNRPALQRIFELLGGEHEV